MRRFIQTIRFMAVGVCGAALAAGGAGQALAQDQTSGEPPLTLVIHGGAGVLDPANYSAEDEAAYLAALRRALAIGYSVLEGGGSSLDAVEATIRFMEDSPLFNAGKGAVFTLDGRNELDASIMDGAMLNVGAVAGVTTVRNPITLARKVMENSPHVMFAREGAESFAQEQGLETVPPDYFYTERRWNAYQRALESLRKEGALAPVHRYGTVGAVALDANGDLAAGTSTGGMTLKKWGRVGDSPIIGAGTFADNDSCAVSATGDGEYFIRATVARDICAMVQYGGVDIHKAAHEVIFGRLASLEGTGGVIVLDPTGDYDFVFNSGGMFRGVRRTGEEPFVAMYGDDE